MGGKGQSNADDKVRMAALTSQHAFHGDASRQALISSGDQIASLLECRCDVQCMLTLVRDVALADCWNFAENWCDRTVPDSASCCDLGKRSLGRANKSRRWQVIVQCTEFRSRKGWHTFGRLMHIRADYPP